jgi:hypothetical protein
MRSSVDRQWSRNRPLKTLQATEIVDPIIERTPLLAMTSHHLYTQAMRAVAGLIKPRTRELLAQANNAPR